MRNNFAAFTLMFLAALTTLVYVHVKWPLAAGQANDELQSAITKPASARDCHTLCNADSIKINHLELDIKVDFLKKIISGSASWSLANENKKKELILDTYDLSIDSVFVDGGKTKVTLDSPVKYLGSALHIPIAATTQQVKIYYNTGSNAHALQWLSAEQTHDKTDPFLFTQSESIYARSWIPSPDGPGIRFTYNARVSVPKALLALMSAENPQNKNDSGIYHFQMEQPIPAYLMALAVGKIKFKSVDARTGIYAEPGMLAKASWELNSLGAMVKAAEGLYGPYRWGRYDVIVLPPSFPIGGMENPRLTFCTPTIIAGDRSLVSLIAHELAHSWSGNLVTNATWNDFWLNEGFTNYFERRITEKMMGKDYADMLWYLGYQILQDQVKLLGDTSQDTRLKVALEGRDPDDGFTDIPYEKGSLFLRMLEDNVGREKMDAFLTKYFAEHAFQTMTTEKFLEYLYQNLLDKDDTMIKKMQIHHWVYEAGIPSNCPNIIPVRFRAVDSEAGKFPVEAVAAKKWSTHEWLYYLHRFADAPAKAQMQQLDALYHLSKTGNSEIADVWFLMAIKAGYKPALAPMEAFLSQVGRRKFLEPLYTEMMKTPEGSKEAKRIYSRYSKNYHPLARESIEKILGLRK